MNPRLALLESGLHRIEGLERSDEPQPLTRRVGGQYLWQVAVTSVPLMAVDMILLGGVIVAARAVVRSLGWGPALDISACFLPIAAGYLVIGAELGLYPGIRLSPIEELRRLFVAVTAIFTVWIVSVAIMPGSLIQQPARFAFFISAYVLYLATLPVFRGGIKQLLSKSSWWGFPTLVCGRDSSAVGVHEWLARNRRLGLRSKGVIIDRDDLEIDGDEPWYAGAWPETGEIAKREKVYWAVVVPPAAASIDASSCVTKDLYLIPHIHILSDLTGLPDHWAPHHQIDGLTGVHLKQNLMLPFPRVVKRCLDLFGALAISVLLSPLLFYIAMSVNLSSRGPILYGHERIGKNGRRFRAWKFRTMFENASDVLEQYLEAHPELREEWERDHKLKHDPRVTRIGRFLRQTSLDELPQLWNVIRGEMSLVGPRPIVTAEITKYGSCYPLYCMVPPGITGLWQVSGRNNTTYEERVELDGYYVLNWSPWMDAYILLRTIRTVLFAEGAY